MKEIKSSPKKEVTPETHSVTKLPHIASYFQLDDSLYSFLDSVTDSFIRKTYRLGDFSGSSDEFLQKMRQKYEGNRELEISDLCVEMTGIILVGAALSKTILAVLLNFLPISQKQHGK